LAPREVDFPYYNLTNGWISTLYLVSDSPQTMDFTLAVKGTQGQTLTTAETIQPRQKLAIDMGSLITQLGGDPTGAFAQGSVSIYFVGTIMPIVGQITVANPQLSLVHESVMVEHDPGRSDIPAVLNGLWWGLGGGRTASVVVSNTSANSQTAQVYLDFQGERHALQNPLTFASYETKVLDIGQLLGSLGVSPAQAPQGGVTIVPSGATPTLIASGRITDPTSGFSSTMDFPAPDLERASALHATGIPIGTPSSDSPFAGAGTFTPHVVVRNLLASPQTVTVTLEYPQPASGSGPASPPLDPVAAQDGTHSPPIVQSPLAPVTVAAYGTQDISLASFLGQLPASLPFISVRIQYSGAPGSLQAQVSSVELGGNLVVDSHVQNEGNGWAGSGANPWHLDNDTESILFLTNESNQPARVGFQITANGSTPYYLTKLVLNPRETRAIDIRKLRDAQQPDLKKNTIPAAASDGSVIWVRGDNLPVMGRLMQIHRQAGMASNYDCCICSCPYSYEGVYDYISPGSSNVAVNGSQSFTFYAAYEDCNGDLFYFNESAAASWSSDDASIASVNSSGTVTGNSAGSTTIMALYDADEYTYISYEDMGCQGYLEGGSGYADVTVADATPVINSISPDYWLVGATTTGVIISGQHFGTSPIVNFSDPAVTCTQTGASDTLITCNITVGANASGGVVNVTVTSQGYNGSGFMPMPNGGSQATSNSYAADKQVPTSLSIVTGTDSTTSEASCTTSKGLAGCGVTRTFTYQVNDQSGQPIHVGSMAFGDVICSTSTNQLNLTGYGTTCGGTTGSCSGTAGPCGQSTNANGQFNESIGVCAQACKSSGSCCTAGKTVANQTWTVAGRTLNSDVKTLTYQCNKISVNGN
jgi:hypothetical protein